MPGEWLTFAAEEAKRDWVTFGMAAGGLALAFLSLAWQVWIYLLSGSRVKVTGGAGLGVGGLEGATYVYVEARNVGRHPVTVTSCGMEPLGQNGTLWAFTHPEPFSAPLPHRLEAGSSATWYLPREELQRRMRLDGLTTVRLRAVARLATGKTVRGRPMPMSL